MTIFMYDYIHVRLYSCMTIFMYDYIHVRLPVIPDAPIVPARPAHLGKTEEEKTAFMQARMGLSKQVTTL